MPPARPRRTFVAALVLLALGLAPTAALAARRVLVLGRFRPTALALPNHSYYHQSSLTAISWHSYGGATATGTATYTFRFCPPGQGQCDLSPMYTDRADIRLTGVKACKGRFGYTALTISTPDSTNSLFETYTQKMRAC
jgi:hypothetical protein